MKELNAVKTFAGPSAKQSVEGPTGQSVRQSAERPADLARNATSPPGPRPTRREFLGIADQPMAWADRASATSADTLVTALLRAGARD